MYSINITNPANLNVSKIMRIWRQPETLCNLAPNIKQVKVIRRERNKLLTFWEVEIGSIKLAWQQWNELNLKQGTIHFKMQEGIFSKYEGFWKILFNSNEKPLLQFCADIDLGIPNFEPHARASLKRFTQALINNFFSSLK